MVVLIYLYRNAFFLVFMHKFQLYFEFCRRVCNIAVDTVINSVQIRETNHEI